MVKSTIYFLILAVFASLIGWYIVKYRRSLIIAGCSEIAADSIIIFNKNMNSRYSYDTIRSRCIQNALSK